MKKSDLKKINIINELYRKNLKELQKFLNDKNSIYTRKFFLDLNEFIGSCIDHYIEKKDRIFLYLEPLVYSGLYVGTKFNDN